MYNLKEIIKSLNLIIESPLTHKPTDTGVSLTAILQRYFVKAVTRNQIDIYLFRNYFVVETPHCAYIYKYMETSDWVALSQTELLHEILDAAIREGLNTSAHGSFDAYDLNDVFLMGLFLKDFENGYFIDNYNHIVKLVRACPFGLRGKLDKNEVIKEYLDVIDLKHFLCV